MAQITNLSEVTVAACDKSPRWEGSCNQNTAEPGTPGLHYGCGYVLVGSAYVRHLREDGHLGAGRRNPGVTQMNCSNTVMACASVVHRLGLNGS